MSKILAILLVVAMLVTVFVGCGEKKDDATQSTGGDASSKTSSLSSDWPENFSFSTETADPSSTTNSTGQNPNDEGWSSWYEPEY